MSSNVRIFLPAWHIQMGKRGAEDIAALIRSAWVQALSIGLNAGQAILLPIMVGPTSFGLFAGIYTNMMVAIGIGRGPVEILVQRGHTHCQLGGGMIYRQQDLIRVYGTSLALAVLLFIGLSVMQRWVVPYGLAATLCVAVGIGAASGLRRGLLITSSRTSRLELLDMVARPAVFLSAAAVCWVLGIAEPLLLWLLGASFILVLAMPNRIAARRLRLPGGSEPAFLPWCFILASNGLSILVKHADIIILGMFLDAATVGRYFIVARIADLAAFGYSFAAARFVHRFAVARRQELQDEAVLLISRAGLFGLAIALVASVAIIAVAPILLPIIDPGLSKYLVPLGILLMGQIINASLGVRGAFLTAINPRYTLGIKLVINPLAIGGMVLAVPTFGPVGAATVTALFVLAMQCANVILLRQILAKEASELALQKGGSS